jgi:hypothetical protein
VEEHVAVGLLGVYAIHQRVSVTTRCWLRGKHQ